MQYPARTDSLLILTGSPRRDGNSAHLADAIRRGAEAAGTRVTPRSPAVWA